MDSDYDLQIVSPDLEQTVGHSDNVPEFFLDKEYFEKKSADKNKSIKNYPACKQLMLQRYSKHANQYCLFYVFSHLFYM